MFVWYEFNWPRSGCFADLYSTNAIIVLYLFSYYKSEVDILIDIISNTKMYNIDVLFVVHDGSAAACCFCPSSSEKG